LTAGSLVLFRRAVLSEASGVVAVGR
jgi:hypothetical protein